MAEPTEPNTAEPKPVEPETAVRTRSGAPTPGPEAAVSASSGRSRRAVLDEPTGPVVTRATFPLTYADCDPAGIVYFATWPVLCERTSTHWLHQQGCDFRRIQAEEGAGQVVRHLDGHFLASAVLHDEITVALSYDRMSRNSYRGRFTLTDQHGTTVAVLLMTYAFAGRDGAKAPVPPSMRRFIGPHLPPGADTGA